MTSPRRPRQGALPWETAAARSAVTPPHLQAQGPDPTELQGILERFVFQNEAKGFAIATLRSDEGQAWTVKGPLGGLKAGEPVRVWGKVEVDPKWGRQFRVESAQPHVPATADGVVHFLKSARVPGVGEALAERVVAALGPEALEKIRQDPDVLHGIAGLTAKKRAAIVTALQEQAAAAATAMFLHGLGVGPGLSARIAEQYGPDTVRLVRLDPYRLADEVRGVGFRTADRIARELGLQDDAPERLRAGLRHAIQELAQDGHTCPPAPLVLERAAAAVGLPPDKLEAEAARLVEAGQLEVVHDPRSSADGWATPALAAAERGLARDLAGLLRASGHDPPEAAEARLQEAERSLGLPLQGRQRQAVREALHDGVLVVTGGPGTGKTTIVRGVLAALASDHLKVLLAAPTGRAARRLAESSGHEAKTLHRLLEFEPRQGVFLRNRDRPLEADVVVVDEVSMVEVPLMAALVAALKPGTRLLLVGDADQLPSVGPGAVLDDLLQSQVVPAVRLDRIWRQGEGSHIAQNAHRVRHGEMPVSAPRGDDGDFFVVPREDPEAVIAALLEIVTRRLPDRHGFDPIADIQVLAPMHRGPLGTHHLNERLREALNPHGIELAGGLRAGDKVIQTRNDYDLEVFNGDVGRVIGPAQQIPGLDACLRIRFGDREVEYPTAQLDQLQLAYAVTVHKSQGSEYPAVVLPIHGQHHVMLQRNLLYTAITRGRRFVVLVGSPRAVERAVHNDQPVHRHTRLRAELRRAVQENP